MGERRITWVGHVMWMGGVGRTRLLTLTEDRPPHPDRGQVSHSKKLTPGRNLHLALISHKIGCLFREVTLGFFVQLS